MEKKSGKFRKKKRNFTQVTNRVLRDPNISLGAKGLYGLIESYLTLENFTLYQSELMKMCKEGERAFTRAWKELKETGYLIQYKFKDEKGYYCYEYELLDDPSEPAKTPPLQNEGMDNESMDIVPLQSEDIQYQNHGIQTSSKQETINNSVLKNTEKEYIENNTLNHSFPFSSSDSSNEFNVHGKEENKPVTNSISFYRKKIKENLDYDILVQIKPYDQRYLDEIVDIILETMLTSRKQIRIAGDDYPTELVKERFMKLNSDHIGFVIECMQENNTKIRNIKQYLKAVLFNAPITMDNYYSAQVSYDMKNLDL